MTHKIVSEMTYNVSSGTLNPTIPITCGKEASEREAEEEIIFRMLMTVFFVTEEAQHTKTELVYPDDLISKIQPYLSPTLVREFGCIYKFVVVDDNGAAIYHLDLKHGMTFVAIDTVNGKKEPLYIFFLLFASRTVSQFR